MCPLENLLTLCVTPVLFGDNYHVRSMKMRRALTMKSKFKFVDELILVHVEADLNFAVWLTCNNLVHTWIINSISPSNA